MTITVQPLHVESLSQPITDGWEGLMHIVGRQSDGRIGKEWLGVDWDLARTKYCDYVKDNNSRTILLGNPNPVEIDEIYTDVQVVQSTDILYQDEFSNDGRVEPDNRPRRSAGQLLNMSSRIYILGKPGAGKTTFLRYLALAGAKGEFARIPILFSLRGWTSKFGLLSQLRSQFDVCDLPDTSQFLHTLMRDGRALLLLDGLDEIKQEHGDRRGAIAEINDIERLYRRTQIILTCRNAAEAFSFDHYDYAQLADFTHQQQRIFISKWFSSNAKKLQTFTQEWEKPESRGHRELGKTPLLLALTCLAFDTHYKFAPNRSQLYEDATSALLSKWDASRQVERDQVYEGLTHLRKRQLLAHLAFQLLRQEKLEFAARDAIGFLQTFLSHLPPRERPPHDVDVDDLFRVIEAQHGLIYEAPSRVYRYSHLTLQEYFAACHVVADVSGERIRAVLQPDCIGTGRWEEVIVHVASLLADADHFFYHFRIALSSILRKAENLRQILKIACDAAHGRVHKVDHTVRGKLPTGSVVNDHEERRMADLALRHLETCATAFVRHRELATGAYEEESVRRARFIQLLLTQEPEMVSRALANERRAVELYSQAMRTYSRCIDLAAAGARILINQCPFHPDPISLTAP